MGRCPPVPPPLLLPQKGILHLEMHLCHPAMSPSGCGESFGEQGPNRPPSPRLHPAPASHRGSGVDSRTDLARLPSAQLENRVGPGPGGEGKAAAGPGDSGGLRGAHGPGQSPRVSVNGDRSSRRPPAHLCQDIINLGGKASGLLSRRTAPLMRLINYSPRCCGGGGDRWFWGGQGVKQPRVPIAGGSPSSPEPSGHPVPQFLHPAPRDHAAAARVGVGGRSDKGQSAMI